MDSIELHDRCVDVFLGVLREVAPGQWDGPTPCTDWTVRELVNHLVNEQRWTVPLMAGETIAAVGDRFDGDLLGEDPKAMVEHAARAAQAAVPPAVLAGRTVHLSFGDTPAQEYARQLAADHLIHAWDLAVAVGAPAVLPGELVDEVAGWFAGAKEDGYRAGGWIGARPPQQGRNPQAALLVGFGRDPGWSPEG